MTNRVSTRDGGVFEAERPTMTTARDRVVIAQLTAALAGDFDLPTVLDDVAHDALAGLQAWSAVVVLRDDRHRAGDIGIQVVAEALCAPTDADLSFVTAGPALVTARDGAITMIVDLAAAGETRWPGYRRDALRAGARGMRGFPLTVMGSSVGALVVHTNVPWGVERSSEFGQTLANLAAIAISIAPHSSQRRADAGETIETLLQGTIVIATATGIIAEVSGSDPAQARLQLHRLARAHQATVTTHAGRIATAYNSDPARIAPLLVAPGVLPPPPRIDN
jgi:hypothetical protein